MPTALAISRYFPPLGSVGSSIRLVKIIKYLTQVDWKFIVFTQDPSRTVIHEEQLSKFMEDEIPAETKIIRVPAPFSIVDNAKIKNKEGVSYLQYINSFVKFFVHLVMPQSSLWWGIKVFFQGSELLNNENVDIIYSVSPVFMNAFVGFLLSYFFHKPFFLDLKDDWVGSQIHSKKNPMARLLDIFFESLIVHHAQKVILVTERSHNLYKNRYPELAHSRKFEFIPNGCDLNEYQSLRERKPENDKTKFRIISAAWGYQKDYRDITPFFKSMHHFLECYPDAWETLEIVLLGKSLSSEYDELLDVTGIKKIITVEKSLQREQMIETLSTADLFLLVQPKNNFTAVSGTIYEYWAIGRAPILLISEHGASSEIVNRYNLGKSFHLEDIDGIVTYLKAVYESKMSGNPITINTDGIEKFDRKLLAYRIGLLWQDSIKPAK